MVIYNLKKRTPIVFEYNNTDFVDLHEYDKTRGGYNIESFKDRIDDHTEDINTRFDTVKYRFIIRKGILLIKDYYSSTPVCICIVYNEDGVRKVVVSIQYYDISKSIKTVVNRFVKHYGFKLSDIQVESMTKIKNMFRPTISIKDYSPETQQNLSALFLNSARTQSNVISV